MLPSDARRQSPVDGRRSPAMPGIARHCPAIPGDARRQAPGAMRCHRRYLLHTGAPRAGGARGVPHCLTLRRF